MRRAIHDFRVRDSEPDTPNLSVGLEYERESIHGSESHCIPISTAIMIWRGKRRYLPTHFCTVK